MLEFNRSISQIIPLSHSITRTFRERSEPFSVWCSNLTGLIPC